MTENIFAIKLVCGVLVVAGLVIGFFERKYKPSALLLEGSRQFPAWLGWLSWILTLAAALGYFFADAAGAIA